MAHPMKTLIIDDDQDITGLLSRYLTAKGFENVVTNDPREGMELIKKEKYDSVLLDIAMPEFSYYFFNETNNQIHWNVCFSTSSYGSCRT